MMKKDLEEQTSLSSATITKQKKGETVTTNILKRICRVLGYDAEDIIEMNGGKFIFNGKHPDKTYTSQICRNSRLDYDIHICGPIYLLIRNKNTEPLYVRFQVLQNCSHRKMIRTPYLLLI